MAGFAVAKPSSSDSPYKQLRVFARALAYIEASYVEPINEQKLMYGAVQGMLTNLDPHSAFLTPEDFKELREDTEGEFTGVGVEIEATDGFLTVISPIEGSPAHRAGIKPGDRIVKINGENAEGFTILDSAKRLRGKPGTQVKLTIDRKGWKQPKDVTITRANIKVVAVEGRLLEPGYGLLRLRQFIENVTEDAALAVQKLETENKGALRGLILDLRDNPGGLLDEGSAVADLFLSSGKIVSTRGRGGVTLDDVDAGSSDDVAKGTAMVVLVNEGSASAAEIVAGALQDQGRALIVGTQSFGKGSVQTVIPLDDGSALKLTIARYYTPNGRSIQGKGIVPDLVVEQLDADELARARAGKGKPTSERDLPRVLKGEPTSPPARDPPGGKPVKVVNPAKGGAPDDFQLKTALDHLKAAQVLGPRPPKK